MCIGLNWLMIQRDDVAQWFNGSVFAMVSMYPGWYRSGYAFSALWGRYRSGWPFLVSPPSARQVPKCVTVSENLPFCFLVQINEERNQYCNQLLICAFFLSQFMLKYGDTLVRVFFSCFLSREWHVRYKRNISCHFNNLMFNKICLLISRFFVSQWNLLYRLRWIF